MAVFCIVMLTSATAGAQEWHSLFDGQTLNGWKPSEWAGLIIVFKWSGSLGWSGRTSGLH
jgi:hypothetical protein